MRKKSTYLYLLTAIIIIIAIGFIMNISQIKSVTNTTLTMMTSPWVCAAAAICAFIFIGNKNYWLINGGCAFIASLAIQFLVIGSGAGLYTILVRALAFLIVVYLLNLIKILFTK